jgi:hypothetical protein
VERVPGDVDDLLQDKVKDGEMLLLHVKLDQVPLILGVGSGISNPRSQGGTKETVKIVELEKKVLSLQRVNHSTRSIHEMHIFWL